LGSDRSVPEVFDDETPDERPVAGDCDRGQAAFVLEMMGELASERGQRGLVGRRLWRWNGASVAQVLEGVTVGRGIPAPETSVSPSCLQELVGEWLMEMGECQVLPSEPPCEIAQEPQALPHGRGGIAQFPQLSGERVQVRGEQVCSVGFDGPTA